MRESEHYSKHLILRQRVLTQVPSTVNDAKSRNLLTTLYTHLQAATTRGRNYSLESIEQELVSFSSIEIYQLVQHSRAFFEVYEAFSAIYVQKEYVKKGYSKKGAWSVMKKCQEDSRWYDIALLGIGIKVHYDRMITVLEHSVKLKRALPIG